VDGYDVVVQQKNSRTLDWKVVLARASCWRVLPADEPQLPPAQGLCLLSSCFQDAGAELAPRGVAVRSSCSLVRVGPAASDCSLALVEKQWPSRKARDIYFSQLLRTYEVNVMSQPGDCCHPSAHVTADQTSGMHPRREIDRRAYNDGRISVIDAQPDALAVDW